MPESLSKVRTIVPIPKAGILPSTLDRKTLLRGLRLMNILDLVPMLAEAHTSRAMRMESVSNRTGPMLSRPPSVSLFVVRSKRVVKPNKDGFWACAIRR